jgi:hypothetical protein
MHKNTQGSTLKKADFGDKMVENVSWSDICAPIQISKEENYDEESYISCPGNYIVCHPSHRLRK